MADKKSPAEKAATFDQRSAAWGDAKKKKALEKASTFDQRSNAWGDAKLKKALEEAATFDQRAIAWGDAQKKKQGTQPNHAVTDNKNHTKPVAEQKMPDNKTKPMSKEDKAARKEFGSKSWNNGYTN